MKRALRVSGLCLLLLWSLLALLSSRLMPNRVLAQNSPYNFVSVANVVRIAWNYPFEVAQALRFNNVRFIGPAGWWAGDIGAQFNVAVLELPLNPAGYNEGTVAIVPGNYTYSTQMNMPSPYVNLEGGSSNLDYQGTATGIFIHPANYVYEANAYIKNVKLTNTTNNWTNGIWLQDTAGFRFDNVIVQGSGSGICLLLDNHTASHFSEKTVISVMNLASCPTTMQFQVTGGDQSFSYWTVSGLSLSPTGALGIGMNILNNAKLNGGFWDIHPIFLPQNGIGIQFANTSAFVGGVLDFRCELQASGPATCLRTNSGTTVQLTYNEYSSNGSITDSIAAGTLTPYIANYQQSGLSQMTATSNGFGVNAGTSGVFNFDVDQVPTGKFPHFRPSTDNSLTSYLPFFAVKGSCTMASGTCSAQTFAGSQTLQFAPQCFGSWTGTGTLTGILKFPSTTTTVTPASSVGTDSAQVNFVCME